MSPARESLARLDAAFTVALRIARSARSGRVALAALAAALDPSWFPRPGADDFLALLSEAEQTAREPLSAREVQRALRDAWGADPGEELDGLDPEPVAITPGAQVHRGELDGEPVAIKLLRPGLAASVRQDLALLQALVAPLGAAFPSLDAGAVLREVRERVLDEFDLESEASTQRRFARALRDHPSLSVPAPVMRLCQEGVLVSAWVDGVPIGEAPDRERAAAHLLAFVLGAARWGVSYADPHPDNVLVTDGGSLAILDFGACRPIAPERLEAAAGVLDAVAGDDAEALGAALAALAWMDPEHAPQALELARALGGPLFAPGPSRLDGAEAVAARRRLVEHADALAALIPHGALAPEDLWPARGVAMLLGTLTRLEVSGDWVALARVALRNGWDAAV